MAAGVVLRLIWAGDMEYKGDEAYLFEQATGPDPWPWTGQTSGVGTPNPGMGIWVYSVLARAIGLDDPVSMVRGVMVLNALAVLGLAAFARRVVPRAQREPWLWATALLAVNPLAILFSRKIWIQSVLPPFVLAVLVAWWFRTRAAAAFAWGLGGAWLGQIHMSGFFFAAGLAGWTALADRGAVRWRWWLAGSLLGALTLIPWLDDALGDSHPAERSIANTLSLGFWRLWLTYPLGVDLVESAGSDLGAFLAAPRIGGVETHLVGVTFAAILVLGIALAVEAIAIAVWPRVRARTFPLGGARAPSTLAVRGALWGYGILLTLSGFLVYRHYLIVAFVLPFLGLAAAALLRPAFGRRVLVALVVAQAILSVSFLAWIHAHGGAPGGDYGVSYGEQR